MVSIQCIIHFLTKMFEWCYQMFLARKVSTTISFLSWLPTVPSSISTKREHLQHATHILVHTCLGIFLISYVTCFWLKKNIYLRSKKYHNSCLYKSFLMNSVKLAIFSFWFIFRETKVSSHQLNSLDWILKFVYRKDQPHTDIFQKITSN